MSPLTRRPNVGLDIDVANKLRDTSVKNSPAEASSLSPLLSPPVLQKSQAQPPSATEITLLADRFLLLEPLEGSSIATTTPLCRCVDTVTGSEFVCREVPANVTSTAVLLQAHERLNDCDGITPLTHVISALDRSGQQKVYLLSPMSHGDLHAYLRSKKRLREAEARSLFLQATQTVAECHSRGVVLTDLRLRRFVFADSERTKIRLESLEDAALLENARCDDSVSRKHGYPAYVTPEVLLSRGGRYSGRASDIWSLGIILYTLLVGRYPFQDSGPLALFTKILRGHFVIPENVSSRARCLIRNLLRRDPTQRLQAADILKHPWFSAALRCDRVDASEVSTDSANAANSIIQGHSRSEVNKCADQVVPCANVHMEY